MNHLSYCAKKVMTIGAVAELTGLTERQIRYYEKKNLISPDRSSSGTRKYSFLDIELLMDIAEKRECGIQTNDILEEFIRKEQQHERMKEGKKLSGREDTQSSFHKHS